MEDRTQHHHHDESLGVTLAFAEPGLHKYAIHHHSGYSIILVTQGAKLFHFNGNELVSAHQSFSQRTSGISTAVAFGLLRSMFLNHIDESVAQAQAQERPSSCKRVQACIEVMRQSLGHTVLVSALAKHADVSVQQIIRDFRLVTGTTPTNYRRYLMVSRAKELLEAGASIADAALDAGFADQSHLSRQFKQAFQMTPLSLRKEYLRQGKRGTV
jgi:AraC-like DNA-binding protein